MALHIQMTPEAEVRLKRIALRNKLSSLLACIMFFLVGGSILYFTAIYISKAMPAAFDVYTPAAEDKPPSNKPKVKELTSKSTPSSSSVAPSVIVSTSTSPIAMAEVDIPTTDVPIGTGMDIDLGLGAGIGTGLGEGGGGMGSGDAGGSALEGTFYDFKLTARGAQTSIRYDEVNKQLVAEDFGKVAEIFGEFFDKSWNPAVLRNYYQAPTKLYASNFYLPDCMASYAPIAFEVQEKVKPSGWCVIYRGKVRAPKSGSFRFVGAGDDLLAVRFDKKMVLESGWVIPSFYDSKDRTPAAHWSRFGSIGIGMEYKQKIASYKGHKDYKLFPQHGLAHWNAALGGLVGGNIFKVEEGKVYPIEILVSEVPGGSFGFILMIQDLANSPIVDGMTQLDIFRTNFSLPDIKDIEQKLISAESKKQGAISNIKYNEDSPIWTAVP